jgi:fucose permease
LIHHLGTSPKTAIPLLAFYWMALLVGRTVAASAPAATAPRQAAVGQRFGHVRLHYSGVHGQSVRAGTAILFIGSGFASIYPLVAERIGRRFPYYNPGLFNGIFSFALMGGMVAPATLGYAAEHWGIGAVAWLPVLGTSMVFVLLLLIWLESKVTGR